MKRVTIRDVGLRAGVSYQTVSRVLNGSGPVGDETRARVLQAISELGFTRDPLAANLASRRSRLIGVAVATYEGNACIQTLEGAGRCAEHAGYAVMIGGGEHRSRSEPELLPFLRRQRIDGLLIIYHGSLADTHRILTEVPASIPIVTTGYAPEWANLIAVSVDSRAGARAGVEHLIRLGHRRIAVITGAPEAFETVQRDAGYRDAMSAANLAVDESLIEPGDWFVESGFDAGERLLSKRADFTAVFAHSDRMAMGCIRSLLNHGLRVPQDVAVVGFNDIGIAGYMVPPLTTVRYPLYDLGGICMRILIDRIEGKPASLLSPTREERALLNPHVVVRESCGAAGRAYEWPNLAGSTGAPRPGEDSAP